MLCAELGQLLMRSLCRRCDSPRRIIAGKAARQIHGRVATEDCSSEDRVTATRWVVGNYDPCSDNTVTGELCKLQSQVVQFICSSAY